MAEWLKAHAWKAISATLTERHRNTSSRNQFTDLQPRDATPCEPVNIGVRRRFRLHLTQFLHSSQAHLVACVAMFVDASIRRAPRSASRTPSGLGGDVQSCMRRQQLEMRRETRDQRRGQQFVSFTIHGRHRWRRPRRPLPRTRGWCLASEDSPSANSKSQSFCSLMSFA